MGTFFPIYILSQSRKSCGHFCTPTHTHTHIPPDQRVCFNGASNSLLARPLVSSTAQTRHDITALLSSCPASPLGPLHPKAQSFSVNWPLLHAIALPLTDTHWRQCFVSSRGSTRIHLHFCLSLFIFQYLRLTAAQGVFFFFPLIFLGCFISSS